mgnify:CR=1 FL=1
MISKRRFIQGSMLATLFPMKFRLLAEESTMQSIIAEIISEYAGQGIHRTGTTVDNQSADWLMHRIEMLDVVATDTAFEFQRLQPITTQLSLVGSTIPGVPLYDCHYTNESAITGSIGELGSNADIGVSMSLPFASLSMQREKKGNTKQLLSSRIAGYQKMVWHYLTPRTLPPLLGHRCCRWQTSTGQTSNLR